MNLTQHLPLVSDNKEWPKKVSHYQIIKILHLIVLKPVIEIRFISQIKVWFKHYNIIRCY